MAKQKAESQNGVVEAPVQLQLINFDDVDSIFMARGSQHAKEWHFSQDSVFFHSIDELDTSRSTIVLTSNRPDLIDSAIQDRFMSYLIDYPDLETLLAVLVTDQLGRLIAEFRIHVVIPECQRLQDVSVGINDIQSSTHDPSPLCG